ncbi:uncharacterized protein LOC111030329 [Myzus persicae]|uniref:uncharacterized protein LOC111030329 n=1 Tax=Myzus persicae TaxID=13164 RepID=UPI000B936599|nr:uncharacterized protein LOC111030329 [Myzus persicae]
MSIPKKNSSIVWKHFRRDPNTPDEATCSICNNKYKRSNGTTNLLDHLKRKHFTVLCRDELQHTETEQIEEDRNQPGTSGERQSTGVFSPCNNPVMAVTSVVEPVLKRQKQLLLSNR